MPGNTSDHGTIEFRLGNNSVIKTTHDSNPCQSIDRKPVHPLSLRQLPERTYAAESGRYNQCIDILKPFENRIIFPEQIKMDIFDPPILP